MTPDARIDKSRYEGQNLFIYVPQKNDEKLLMIEEGAGDNLQAEDLAEGYIDYINYSIGSMRMSADDLESPSLGFSFEDGGMVMFRECIRDMTIGDIASCVMKHLGYDWTFGMLLKGE